MKPLEDPDVERVRRLVKVYKLMTFIDINMSILNLNVIKYLGSTLALYNIIFL